MISKSTVLHIANLAKLKISDDEAEKYSAELSQVLTHIDELQNVDTTSVEIGLAEALSLGSLREDAVKPWAEEEKQVALNQAERGEDGLVKVPRVM